MYLISSFSFLYFLLFTIAVIVKMIVKNIPMKFIIIIIIKIKLLQTELINKTINIDQQD